MRRGEDSDFEHGSESQLFGLKSTFGKTFILFVFWLVAFIVCATISIAAEDNPSTTENTLNKPDLPDDAPTSTLNPWNLPERIAEREEKIIEGLENEEEKIKEGYANLKEEVKDEVKYMSNETHDPKAQCASCAEVTNIAVSAGMGHECAAACVAAAAASGHALGAGAAVLGAVCGKICNMGETKFCNKMVETGDCALRVCEEVNLCTNDTLPQTTPTLSLASNSTDGTKSNCDRCKQIANGAVNGGVGHGCASACVTAASATDTTAAILGAFCGKFCNMIEQKFCSKMIDSGDCAQELCEETPFCPKDTSTSMPLDM